MREFTDQADRIRAAGLDLLALSVDGLGADDSSATAAREALLTRRYPFPAGLATQELLSQLEVLRTELFSNARPFPVPSCFLIDSHGELAAVYVGPVSVDHLLADVARLADAPTEQRIAAMPLAGRWLSEPRTIRLAPIANSMRYANHTSSADWYQLRAAPQTAISHCGLALDAERGGDLGKARTHYKEALQLASQDAEVQNYVGEFFMRQRDFKSALRRFQLATKLVGDSANTPVATDVAASCHYNLGTLLISAGRTADAEAALRSALQFDPQHALAHTALGKLFLGARRLDEAQEQLEAALQSDPHLIPAHVYLGRVFLQRHELDSAAQHFEKAIALDDRLVDAHTDLARVLGAQGKVDEAVRHYRRSLQLQPTSHAVALELAWCLATCPDDAVRSGAEALRLAQAAIEAAASPSPVALDILAAAQAETGDFKEAIRTLRQADSLAAGKPRLQQSLRQHRQQYEQRKPLRNSNE
jgi:Tfp pilus assembly protein PilF/peroxiredoxin